MFICLFVCFFALNGKTLGKRAIQNFFLTEVKHYGRHGANPRASRINTREARDFVKKTNFFRINSTAQQYFFIRVLSTAYGICAALAYMRGGMSSGTKHPVVVKNGL